MSVQRVYLCPHDPAWAGKFQQEAGRVSTALGTALTALHHIGSTAIPGISAKPIIDLLAEVPSLPLVDAATSELVALGYEALGEFGIPERRYFRKDDTRGEREYQIHAFAAGSPQVLRHLRFRDYLRAHSDWAQRYEALKKDLAVRFPQDIARYATGKDDFIREVDALAAVWAEQNGGESLR